MTDRYFTEQDWKLFRSRIGGWQQAYMQRLNEEYIALLSSDAEPSEKFWALEKRIKEDKRNLGVVVRMSRSMFVQNLFALLHRGVIALDDLDGFSEGLRERMEYLVRSWASFEERF